MKNTKNMPKEKKYLNIFQLSDKIRVRIYFVSSNRFITTGGN